MKSEYLIHIAAPPELVWQVVTDIDNWPQWTPTVDAAKRLDDGPFAVGSQALMKQPGLPEATWTVTELTDGARFIWESRLYGVQVAATHEVAPADGGCHSQLYFETKGIAGFLVSPLISRAIGQAIARENNGLKAYCEAKSGATSPIATEKIGQAGVNFSSRASVRASSMARSVSRLTTPVGSRSLSNWNITTARRVFLPNTPSAFPTA